MSTLTDKLTANGTIRGVVRIVFAHIGSAIVFVFKFVFIDVTDAIWGGLYRWLDSIRPRILVFLFIPLVIGVTAMVTFDYTDEYLSTDIFCVKACHVMEYPYEELKKSKHWNSPSGIRPTCADCHVSGRLTFAMWDHFIGTGELFIWYTTDFSEKETFDWLRPSLAESVRLKMLEDDSANCRDCHLMEAIKPEKKRGQKQHKRGMEEGTTCIVCHYDLVHQKVKPSQRFLNKIDEIDELNALKRQNAKEKEKPKEKKAQREEKEKKEAKKSAPLVTKPGEKKPGEKGNPGSEKSKGKKAVSQKKID